MVEPVRHRRTKGAATDMFEPKATASHLDSTQSRPSRPITTDTRRLQRDGDRRHSTRCLCLGISEVPVLVVFVFALFLHQSALHHRLSAVRSLLQSKLQSPRQATRVRRMIVPARSFPSSARPPR